MKRYRLLVIGAVLLAATAALSAQSPESLSVRRFGFYVASNNGGADRQRLLYADDDVETLARTMSELGGVSPLDEVSLFEPDARELDVALDLVHDAIVSADDARRTEVFFYYSGHSDESGLMLGDDRYSYGHLRDRLESLDADVIVAVLDSCASGAFTRDKGGTRRAPFLIDDSSRMEGHAFLTSSSADEVSQESDSIGGSFFTHYLVSGLRGAADTTRDGRVTLNEIYQHTYSETLARTEQTLGGPQHPAYDIRLTGTGDLVLTDLSRPTASLVLAEDVGGRVAVRNDTGRLVAEIDKRQDEAVTMALPPGSYTLALQQDNSRYSGSVELLRGRPAHIDADAFSRVRPEYTQFRGTEEQLRDRETFSFGVTPSLSYPSVSDAIVGFQVGVPIASAWAVKGAQGGLVQASATGGVKGFQGSFIGAKNDGPLSGFQLGYIYADTAGAVSGSQAAGIFTRSHSLVEGAQVAGIFNTAGGEVKGTQVAGIFNSSNGAFYGAQVAGIANYSTGVLYGVQAAGIYNSAEEVYGAQIGLVNVSTSSSGLLVGLVNVSDDMRAFPLGLVNFSRNGIRDLDFRQEQGGRSYVSFKTGNRYYYTRFILGFSDWSFNNDGETLVFGFGAGFRATLRPFYLEFDVDARTAVADYSMYDNAEEAWQNVLFLPTFSLTAGLGRRFGIYGGLGMTLKTPGMNRDSVLMDGGNRFDLSSDGSWEGVLHWYGGFHF